MNSEDMLEREAETSSTAQRTLRDGAKVTLTIDGHPDAERLAQRGLAVAIAEVERNVQTRDEAPLSHPKIIGKSAAMQTLFRMLDRIRNSDATALVLGENGTGKELVARAIHEQSRRANRQFVATNCSAFNDNLLESELFGHKRGAFTGAVSDKPGLFEVADGGTFFMDEVGDMSPGMQVKLLRVLQEGTFNPVGAGETRRVDVRIIAATNRDLASMVKEGTFREDLYYRLHVVSLRVPPLRERDGDVRVLIDFFLQRLSKRDGRSKTLTPRTIDRLVQHEWPGNVRELENEMERLWVLSGDDNVIDEDLLSAAIGRTRVLASRAPVPESSPSEESVTAGLSLPDAVESLERRMITEELRKARGNKTKAAEALQISRRNLIRKVQAYGLEDAGKARSLQPMETKAISIFPPRRSS